MARLIVNKEKEIDFTNYVNERTQDFTGREWLFKLIQNWLADTNGSRYFLLKGEPGSGKTAIAGEIVKNAAAQKATTQALFPHAAHFCSASRLSWIVPTNFAESIALQLAQIEEFAKALLEIDTKQVTINSNVTVGTAINNSIQGVVIHNLNLSGVMSAQEAFNLLVLNPLKKIYKNGFQQQIAILVDSLDESLTFVEKTTIVDLLSAVQELPKQVRFLLTSRPKIEALKHLEKYASVYSLSMGEGLQESRKDVNKYILENLDQQPDLSAKFAVGLSKDDFVSAVGAKSDGNFLYITYLLKMLTQEQSEISKTVIDKLPDGLDGIYQDFLHRLVGSERKTWRNQYAPVLGTLAVVQEALSKEQLAKFVDMGKSEVQGVLEDLLQFLDVDDTLPQSQRTYTIYHRSLADFLFDEDRAEIYHCDEQEQHERIVSYYRNREISWNQNDLYLWNYLTYHLSKANKAAELRALLLNFDWLQAKLNATNIYALIPDYSFLPDDVDLQLLQSALQLAANVLTEDKTQLAGQLLGHVLPPHKVGIQTLLEKVKLWKATPWLRPIIPSLIPAGGPLLRVFSGHQEWVNSLAVTPDGKWVVSGSSDGIIKVWDLKIGNEVLTFKGHERPKKDEKEHERHKKDEEKIGIRAVVITPDGRQVVSVADGDSPKIWSLKIWSLKDGKEIYSFSGGVSSCYSLAITPDGKQVILGLNDGTIQVCDFNSGNLVQCFKGHSESISTVAVTPDEMHIVSGSSEGTLEIWNLKNGQKQATFRGHDKSIHAVGFTQNSRHISLNKDDGVLLISASGDGTIKVWDLSNVTKICTLRTYEAYVNAVAVTPDGKYLVSGSFGNLKIWDLNSGKLLHTFSNYVGNVRALDISPDGNYIISSSNQNLKVWNFHSRVELPKPVGHENEVDAITVTTDGEQAISASIDGDIKIWDLGTGEEVFRLEGHPKRDRGYQRKVNNLVVVPDNKQLISSSFSNIKLWDLKTGALIDSLSVYERDEYVGALTVTPDGEQIVAVLNSMAGVELGVWDVNSRSAPYYSGPDFFHPSVYAVAVTSDMKYVILGSTSHLFKMRNLNDGKEVSTFPNEQWNVTGDYNRNPSAMAILPSGLVVSGLNSTDGTLKVWNLKDGTKPQTLVSHMQAISAVSVTDSGERVISVSEDGTLKVWDLNSNKLIASYSSDVSLYSCAVAPDGKTIVAGDGDGRVHFLYLEGA